MSGILIGVDVSGEPVVIACAFPGSSHRSSEGDFVPLRRAAEQIVRVMADHLT